MGTHETYLTIAYGVSIALLVVYRLWIAGRRRRLEQERQSLEQRGGRLEGDV